MRPVPARASTPPDAEIADELLGVGAADAGALQDVGGDAELPKCGVRDRLAACIGLPDLDESLLERTDVAPARLHAGQLDLEVAAALDELELALPAGRPERLVHFGEVLLHAF